MGLDMYLRKGKKIPKRDFTHIRKINDLITNYDDELVTEAYKDYVFECGSAFKYNSLFKEIVYWRKANQIHKWFVDNVQEGIDDCGYYEVSKQHIEKLLEICELILDEGIIIKLQEEERIIQNKELCEALLPTQSGFFFGGTEYDEWYIKDLEYTVQELKKILKEFDFENEYLIYTSSW